MRRGDDINFVPIVLQKVVSAVDAGWVDGSYYGSLVARIGEVIGEHLKNNVSSGVELVAFDPKTDTPSFSGGGEVCDQCGLPTMFRIEGCKTCRNCGYSSCG
jgi:ribonucleoside-diphosphate reductase alpha chain